MKTLIIIGLVVITVIAGLLSLSSYRASDYDLSHILVIAAYLSIVFTIYELTVKKKKIYPL